MECESIVSQSTASAEDVPRRSCIVVEVGILQNFWGQSSDFQMRSRLTVGDDCFDSHLSLRLFCLGAILPHSKTREWTVLEDYAALTQSRGTEANCRAEAAEQQQQQQQQQRASVSV